MIAIIDYGMGNLHSVKKAIEKVGGRTILSNSMKEITSAEGIVLPGVGAFKSAMHNLKRLKLLDIIYKAIEANKPFFGICLGLQLLFTESEEDGGCKGLNVFKGKVKRFDFASHIRFRTSQPLKVPHMGWNQVQQLPITNYQLPILRGIPDGSYFYFVHSYYVQPKDKSIIATVTDYGIKFVSSISKGNLFACQFHPEKSQKLGLQLLKNFVELVEKC